MVLRTAYVILNSDHWSLSRVTSAQLNAFNYNMNNNVLSHTT
jgi:hypothetical protein